jgi:hypothetical protein
MNVPALPLTLSPPRRRQLGHSKGFPDWVPTSQMPRQTALGVKFAALNTLPMPVFHCRFHLTSKSVARGGLLSAHQTQCDRDMPRCTGFGVVALSLCDYISTTSFVQCRPPHESIVCRFSILMIPRDRHQWHVYTTGLLPISIQVQNVTSQAN